MSIGINNADSSFFRITGDDIALGSFLKKENKNINNDIISLEIVEECQKINSGSLTLYDPNLIYPRDFLSIIFFQNHELTRPLE